MKPNFIFKFSSILCLILFYLVLLIAVFTLIENVSYIWWPDSSFTKSFGTFEPIYGYMNLDFYQQPELYAERSFRLLSLLSNVTLLLFALSFLWLLYKFLKNISKEGLFMYQNVTILFWMGIVFAVLGAATTYTDGLLLSKAITEIDISNASISFSNIAYADFIIAGIVMILIASALKTAVHAVDENRKTI